MERWLRSFGLGLAGIEACPAGTRVTGRFLNKALHREMQATWEIYSSARKGGIRGKSVSREQHTCPGKQNSVDSAIKE